MLLSRKGGRTEHGAAWENLWGGRCRCCLDLERFLEGGMCVGRFWGSRMEKLLSSLSAERVPTGANSGVGLDFREVSELGGTWAVPGRGELGEGWTP